MVNYPFELSRRDSNESKYWIKSTIDIAVSILNNRINSKNLFTEKEFKINENITRELLGRNIWKFSEAYGKFKGCPFWSVNAYNHYLNLKKQKKTKIERDKLLRHEHIYPQIKLIKKMKELSKPNTKIIKDLFYKYAIATVVTKAENDNLNKLGLRTETPSDTNIWLRYQKARIFIKKNTLHNDFFEIHEKDIEAAGILK